MAEQMAHGQMSPPKFNTMLTSDLVLGALEIPCEASVRGCVVTECVHSAQTSSMGSPRFVTSEWSTSGIRNMMGELRSHNDLVCLMRMHGRLPQQPIAFTMKSDTLMPASFHAKTKHVVSH